MSLSLAQAIAPPPQRTAGLNALTLSRTLASTRQQRAQQLVLEVRERMDDAILHLGADKESRSTYLERIKASRQDRRAARDTQRHEAEAKLRSRKAQREAVAQARAQRRRRRLAAAYAASNRRSAQRLNTHA